MRRPCDNGRGARPTPGDPTGARIHCDERAVARLTQAPLGRPVRLAAAVAPAVAPVRRERLAHCYNDDTRGDDDRSAAAPTGGITDNDTTGRGDEEQRREDHALHDGLRLNYGESLCETNAALARRFSVIPSEATDLL